MTRRALKHTLAFCALLLMIALQVVMYRHYPAHLMEPPGGPDDECPVCMLAKKTVDAAPVFFVAAIFWTIACYAARPQKSVVRRLPAKHFLSCGPPA